LGESQNTAASDILRDTDLYSGANNTKSLSDALVITNTTTKGDYDTNVSLVASQLVLSNIAAANLVSQTTQTASQLAVKTLAASEKDV